MVAIDARFPALLRLVKAWAKAQGINNAHEKTFNSYALSMLVSFANIVHQAWTCVRSGPTNDEDKTS